MLIAGVPAGSRVRARVAAVQRSLLAEPVTLIPPEWLHVTVATIGWADEVSTSVYKSWRDGVAEAIDDRYWPSAFVDQPMPGLTGVHLRFSESFTLAAVGAIAKNRAWKAGLQDAHTPKSPHLGVAYVREDHPDRTPDVPWQPAEPLPWLLDVLQVVHLIQDAEAGFYRWTVVDEFPVGNAPVR